MKLTALISSRRLRVFVLASALTIAAAGCSSDNSTEQEVAGVVASVQPERQVLELVHGDIPGYMPAMQMPFPVEEPELLDGLRMGDQVRFRLRITNGAAMITGVDKLPPFSGPLPAFSLARLDGGTMTSSDLSGKVAVINFWASWCEPCKTEMPVLEQLTHEYPADDFTVVGIAQDPENRDTIDALLSELGVTYPILLTEVCEDDEDDAGCDGFEDRVGGIPVIPGTLIVGRDGQVAEKRLGIFESEDELRSIIESLL
jgi:thiol-disulfide isomerase/thioredoxin